VASRSRKGTWAPLPNRGKDSLAALRRLADYIRPAELYISISVYISISLYKYISRGPDHVLLYGPPASLQKTNPWPW